MRSLPVLVLLALAILGGALAGWTLVGPALPSVLGKVAAKTMVRPGSTPEETRSVVVSPEGVTMSRSGASPACAGSEQLVEVAVVTKSAGPREDDVYLVLHGADGGSCLVRNPVAKKVVPWLLQLPGLDYEKFLAAMGSTAEAALVCCMGRAGDGRIAAGAVPAMDGATRVGR